MYVVHSKEQVQNIKKTINPINIKKNNVKNKINCNTVKNTDFTFI